MNAHQRRKARRAKDRAPWVMYVPADATVEWLNAMIRRDAMECAGIPLIRGEI